MKKLISLVILIVFTGSAIGQISAEDYGVCFDNCAHEYEFNLDIVNSYIDNGTLHIEGTMTMSDGTSYYNPGFSMDEGIFYSIDGVSYDLKSFQTQSEATFTDLYLHYNIPDTAFANATEIYIKPVIDFWTIVTDSLGNLVPVGFIIEGEPFLFSNQMITGLNNTGKSPILQAFPNPADNFVTISAEPNTTADIYNVIGNKVKRNVPCNAKIDIPDLNPGLYIARQDNKAVRFYVQ